MNTTRIQWQGTYHGAGRASPNTVQPERYAHMHGIRFMRTAAFLLCRAASAVDGCRAKRTDLDASGDFGNLPVPAWAQADHRFVLQTGSSRHWRRRVRRRTWMSASDTTRLKTRAGISRPKRWSRSGATGRSKEKSAAVHSRSVRRLARSAPCVTWDGSTISASGRRAVFDDRSAFRLRETTFGTRGWFQRGSSRAGGRQHRGIHARSRPRHQPVGPFDRRGLHAGVGARLRRRTDVRQVSRLCRVLHPRLPIPAARRIGNAIAAPTRSRSRPSATTHRARTTSIAWKPKFSSAFPDSARASV